MGEHDISSRRLVRDARVADLVRAERFDDALRELHEARDATPGDADIASAIHSVRERQLRHGLQRLGSLDAIPRRLREHATGLGADAHYVVDLVHGTTSIDELLDRSTLGRHRTVRALVELLERGMIELGRAARSASTSSAALGSPSPTGRATERHVIVADGNGPQAALTRTMIRLALGASARLETVASTPELVAAVEKQRADLLVVEFTLPGSDGLAALRAVRRAAGEPLAAIVVAQRIEVAYVEPRLPERSAVLARPIEKASLLEALGSLGIASVRGRG